MANLTDDLEELDTSDETDLADEDYGFIISPNGQLKSFFVPVDDFEIDPPEVVIAILKLLGINNINDALEGNPTIH